MMRSSWRQMIRVRRTAILVLTICGLWAGMPVHAHGGDVELEYKVKAAFLLNFGRFITWPEAAWPDRRGPFTMCVAGADPFGPYLQAVEEKQVDGRPVKVKTGAGPQELAGQCQLVFVAVPEGEQLRRLLKTVEGRPVVTVSDIPGFAAEGGIFEFTTRGGRLGFIINNTQARKQGVQISASLLNLATEVL